MDRLGSDHVGTPTDNRRNNRGAVFSVHGPCREDIREYGNGSSVQLSVGDGHGKLEVEEELEVSL
jgi:hypothetical protein